jgi:hypothetical protein
VGVALQLHDGVLLPFRPQTFRADVTAYGRQHFHGVAGQQHDATDDEDEPATNDQKLFLKADSHVSTLID